MKQFILIAIAFLFLKTLSAQSPGSRVSFKGIDGITYTGVITEILGEKYKVKYDGYNYEAWLTNPKFTILSQNAPLPANTNRNSSSTGFVVGDKVEVKDHDGSWLPAQVLEADAIKGYKIHYVDWSSNWDTWVKDNRIRAVGNVKNNTTSQSQIPNVANTNVATHFKVGDKVEVRDHDGSWLPAQVLEADVIKGYKIHYIGWSSNWDTWVKDDRIRAVGSKKESKPATYEYNKAPKDPEMNGALPKIKGTAWSILSIYNKGTVPKYEHIYPAYLFRNDGRYEIHHRYMFTMGIYSVKGNQVTQVADGSDRLTETYTLKWNAEGKYLELIGQKIIYRLQYNTTTTR